MKKIFNAGIVFILIFLLGLSLVYGISFFSYSGDSMIPKYSEGQVLVSKCNNFDLKVNDTIIFENPKESYDYNIVHNIVRMDENYIKTKGINNDYVDPFRINYSEVKCKVVN